MKTPATLVENTQELRDALFRAICLLDHAKPENDTDHCDVAAAHELSKLRETLNQAAYRTYIVTLTGKGFYKVIDQATGKVASLKGLPQTNLGSRERADEVASLLNQQQGGKTKA
jgi:hypothetical protein